MQEGENDDQVEDLPRVVYLWLGKVRMQTSQVQVQRQAASTDDP